MGKDLIPEDLTGWDINWLIDWKLNEDWPAIEDNSTEETIVEPLIEIDGPSYVIEDDAMALEGKAL